MVAGCRRRGPARRACVGAALLAAALGAGCALFEPVRPPAEPGPLERADAHFQRGDYPAAAAAYEEHLEAFPEPAEPDRALFRLGLIRALPGHAGSDAAAARAHLRRLVDSHPASPWAGPARYLLDLDREVRELRRQLEEIKRIDLEGTG